MTLRPFDPDVARQRLADIRRCLDRLASLGEVGAAGLAEDWRLQATAERMLTVLVEAAVKLNTHLATTILGQPPADYRTSFDAAARAGAIDAELATRLAPSAGLRNVPVHGYDDVDLELLADGIEAALADYPAYVAQMARFAREQATRAGS